MCSRTQCKGALYARKITLQPDVIMTADLLDPEGDEDGDGIENIIETVMGSDPMNSSDYPVIHGRDKLFIDNTVNQNVTYDFSVYPDYSQSDEVTISFSAGTLNSQLVPVPAVSNNSGPISVFIPGTEGYVPVGRYLEYKGNALTEGSDVLIPIPIPDNELVFASQLAVAQFIDGQWSIKSIAEIDNNAAYVLTDRFSPMILVAKQSNIVAYGDNSVYSGTEDVGISVSIELRNSFSMANSSFLIMNYEDPAIENSDVTDTIVFESGDNCIYINEELKLTGNVEITSVQLLSPGDQIDYISPLEFLPDLARQLKYYAIRRRSASEARCIVTNRLL